MNCDLYRDCDDLTKNMVNGDDLYNFMCSLVPSLRKYHNIKVKSWVYNV